MIRVQTKTIGVRKRTGLGSGIVRNEPGMAGNDFLEKLLGNCCALLTTKDDGEGWVR